MSGASKIAPAPVATAPVIEQYTKIPDDLREKIEYIFNKMKIKEEEEEWLDADAAAKFINLKDKRRLNEKLKDLIGYSKPDKYPQYRKSDLQAYMMRHYHKPR